MVTEERDDDTSREQRASVFHKGETRLGFGVGFLVMFVFGLWLWPRWPAARIVQPIAFNHALHAEAGLECRDCHAGALQAAVPGLPANAICADCHEEPIGDSVAEQRLLTLLSSGDPIAWQPLFRQPAHVFFSHRRHTASAEIECVVCHGNVGESTAPPRSQPQKLSMDDCTSCHLERGARNDCTACHR